MPVVVVLIGYAKSQKESQRISAFLNGEKLTWTKDGDSYNGHFVTPTSQRQSKIWFLTRCEPVSGDVFRLETSVFMTGAGPDEERTRMMEWVVDDTIEPTEFSINKLGHPQFPLIAGCVRLLQTRTQLEDRLETGETLLRESQTRLE